VRDVQQYVVHQQSRGRDLVTTPVSVTPLYMLINVMIILPSPSDVTKIKQ